MKWFKHLSDSRNDPFINELFDKHGWRGYGIFFAILEVYAREFNDDSTWVLRLSNAHSTRLLFGAKLKSIRAVLDFISRKWEISWDDRQQVVEIKIPKFKQLLDGEAVKKASEKRQPGDNRETTRRQPTRQPKDIRETALELEPDLEKSLLHKTSFKTRVEQEEEASPEGGLEKREAATPETKIPDRPKGWEKIPVEYLAPLLKICQELSFPMRIQGLSFVSQAINDWGYADIILKAMGKIKDNPHILDTWDYAMKIVMAESQNRTEARNIAEHEQLKKEKPRQAVDDIISGKFQIIKKTPAFQPGDMADENASKYD